MFETGHVMDNTLTVSGGDERRTFYLSANRMDNRGFVVGPKDEYARNTARLKATQMIGSQLRLGGNIAYVDTRGSYIQRGNNVSGIMLGGLRTPPEFDNRNYIDPVTGQQRSYRFQNPYPGSEILGRGFERHVHVVPQTKKERRRRRSLIRQFWRIAQAPRAPASTLMPGPMVEERLIFLM